VHAVRRPATSTTASRVGDRPAPGSQVPTRT
jgi:hypothetical protein